MSVTALVPRNCCLVLSDGGLLLVLQSSFQSFLGCAVWHWANHIHTESPSYISATDTNTRFFNPQY